LADAIFYEAVYCLGVHLRQSTVNSQQSTAAAAAAAAAAVNRQPLASASQWQCLAGFGNALEDSAPKICSNAQQLIFLQLACSCQSEGKTDTAERSTWYAAATCTTTIMFAIATTQLCGPCSNASSTSSATDVPNA
jgi:hypothetical protein